MFIDLNKPTVAIDDIVIAQPEQFPKVIIKRVLDNQTTSQQQYFLISDNTQSTHDSRLFGWVNETDIIGVVQWSF